jgi:hypothetical protein
MSPSLLPKNTANPLIMGKCHSTAIGLYKMQHPRLLTLCQHSVDGILMLCDCSVNDLLTFWGRSLSGEVMSTITILPGKVANTSIMDESYSTALG